MSCWTKEELENMLEDVVNELNLSDSIIEKHGPMGTAPSELVRFVLEGKDREIRTLESCFGSARTAGYGIMRCKSKNILGLLLMLMSWAWGWFLDVNFSVSSPAFFWCLGVCSSMLAIPLIFSD